jgi:DnaK suppressor protein
MDPARARELLRARREQIESDLTNVLAPQAGGEDTNPEAGPDLLNAEVSRATAEPLRDELEAIARAEKRLDDGTYGISVDSGQPIPDARLEAIPWAERTAEEQTRADAEAGYDSG